MSGFFADGRWWDLFPEEEAEIRMGADRLKAAGIDAALEEARRLYVASSDGFGDLDQLIARRAAREPMSHLVGFRAFYRHQFRVTADVLDPRPETEVLVQAALDRDWRTVLDLGTGSGCILLSLLADRAGARGVGTDLSDAALRVAAANVRRLGLEERAILMRSDWYGSVMGVFDLIVSNPPYIAAAEMGSLQPEVRLYEPRMALTDEGDGLMCYRAIVAGAARHLAPGGTLMVEIGPTQAGAVGAMMQAGGFAQITVLPDLDGRDRVVSGRNRPD